MKKYEYLLFDLDGTLIYSHEGIFACMRHALAKMGETVRPTDEFLRKTIGPPLEFTFENFFGMSKERAKEATRIYREEYSKTGVEQNYPVEGAKEALETLKERGYVLAVATSKPRHFAENILNRLGFAAYFTQIVGCGTDGSLPTKSAVVAETLKRLGAENSRSKCLMLGDRKQDVLGARENKIDAAIVDVGYAEEGEIEACRTDYVFGSFAQLIKRL